MSSLTIIPQKKVKGFLKAKRKIQKYSERDVQLIAKNLRVPFAATEGEEREILARWKTVLRDPFGKVLRDHKGRPLFLNPSRNGDSVSRRHLQAA